MCKTRESTFLASLGAVMICLAVGCSNETKQATGPEPVGSGLEVKAAPHTATYIIDAEDYTREGVGVSCDAFFPVKIAQNRAEDKALDKMQEAYVRQVAAEIRASGERTYYSEDAGKAIVWRPTGISGLTDRQLVDKWGETLADSFTEWFAGAYIYVGVGAAADEVTVCPGFPRDGKDCGKEVKVTVDGNAGILISGPERHS